MQNISETAFIQPFIPTTAIDVLNSSALCWPCRIDFSELNIMLKGPLLERKAGKNLVAEKDEVSM